MSVDDLRRMFRGLQEWRSLYEASGDNTVVDPRGHEWNLFDVEVLYEMSQLYPTSQQQKAVKFLLYQGLSEEQAALAMGTARTNSVGEYATKALETLVRKARAGMLPTPAQFRKEKAAGLAGGGTSSPAQKETPSRPAGNLGRPAHCLGREGHLGTRSRQLGPAPSTWAQRSDRRA